MSSHLVRLKSTTPVLRPRKSPPSWPGILFRPREPLFPWPGILLSETKSRNSPAAFLYLRICGCRKISQGRYFQILFVSSFYLLTSVSECALIAIVIICSYFGSVKPNENIFFVSTSRLGLVPLPREQSRRREKIVHAALPRSTYSLAFKAFALKFNW